MNSLSGKTSLLATGPLNRPLFSSIQRIRCNGTIFAITASCLFGAAPRPAGPQPRDGLRRGRRSKCAMLSPVSGPLRSALALGAPRGRPAAYREVADALTPRGHRALEPLAPPRVKEPFRREPVAVGADANRQSYDRAQPRAQPADLRRRERVGPAARVDAGLIEHLVGDPVAHPR